MKNNYYLAYYSHSKRIFDTEIKKLEYNFLKSNLRGNIICPNKHLDKFKPIEPFLEFIKKVDCLLITEYDGYLGKEAMKNVYLRLKNVYQFIYILQEDMKWSLN